MNNFIKNKTFIIVILFLILSPLKLVIAESDESDNLIGLNTTDQVRILGILSSKIVDSWMDSIVDNTGANNELALSIVRQAVLNDLKDYLLIEAPKEVVFEIAKTVGKLYALFVAPDIKSVLSNLEELTVKESVKYLMSWLGENNIKIGMGDLSDSYTDLTGKDSEANFQYVILYEPKTEEIGLVSIKIYSSKAINPPKSQGSIASGWGTTWNYTQEHEKGQKIPPFIVSISGRMKRSDSGYWKDDITHRYSWIGKPRVEVEFPKEVEYFKFNKKGFFEKTKDKITDLFDKVKNSIDKFKDLFEKLRNSFGASLVNPPVDKKQRIQEIANDLADLFKKIEEKVPEEEFEEIEKEIEEVETEEDLSRLFIKIKDLEIDIKLLQFLISQLEDIPEEVETEISYPQLIINEVCVGFYGSKNEFIELYNPNKKDISLDDFILELVDSNNKPTNKKITWENTVIPAESYFLLVGGELIYGGKTLSPDATFSSQLTGSSGVIIKNSQDHIYDKMSFGKPDKKPPILAIEQRGKILSRGLKTGQSLERLRYEDTDNNWDDFYHKIVTSPTNSKGDKFKFNTGSGGGGSSSTTVIAVETTVNTSSLCSNSDASSPSYTPVIINEIAWMGTGADYRDEWIELRNLTDSSISLENWELLINDSYIKFGSSDNISANGYFLMERKDNESVPSIMADHIYPYSFSLNNSDVDVKLFNNNCESIDRVTASPDWPKGDNETKRTMERDNSLNWHDYYGDGENSILGTPKAENSQEIIEEEIPIVQGGEETPADEDDEEEEIITESVIITEVRSTGNYEFVELYNPSDDSVVTEGLYIAYYSSDRDWNNPFRNKQFNQIIIESKEYYLIGFGDYPNNEEMHHDWKPYEYVLNLNNESGAIGIFNCDVGSKETPEAALECKIDALGWGESIVKEGDSAIVSENSMSRIITVDMDETADNFGYLTYQDTDNNKNDFESQDSTPKIINNHDYSDLDNDLIIDSVDLETIIKEDITLPAGEYTFKDFIINDGITVTALSDSGLEEFKGVKLIADNITLNENSYLTADYNGYESGFGPGLCGTNDSFGASYGGLGGRCEDIDKVYGDLFSPIDLGTGAPLVIKRKGGSGGGALILDVSGNLIVDGIISTNGGDGLPQITSSYAATAGGSGGSIYLTSDTLSGLGIIRSNGGNVETSSGAGSGGRISLNYSSSSFSGDVQAYGGHNLDNNAYNGGPGSIYQQGDLIFDNDIYSGDSVLRGDSLVFDSVSIKNNSNVFVLNNVISGDMIIDNSFVQGNDSVTLSLSGDLNLNQSSFAFPALKILTISAQDILLQNSTITANTQIQATNLSIDNNSLITSKALGYSGQEGPGSGINAIGGGYGGIGGRSYEGSDYGRPYGDSNNPQEFGSAGGDIVLLSGAPKLAGNGGGKHQMSIINNLTVDGGIDSNGGDGKSSKPTTSAGSGGSINITTGYLLGSGIIESNGGTAYSGVGAGGGGRIKIVGDRIGFNGTLEAKGGISDVYNGSDGSVE